MQTQVFAHRDEVLAVVRKGYEPLTLYSESMSLGGGKPLSLQETDLSLLLSRDAGRIC
jgi:hypothetical protein